MIRKIILLLVVFATSASVYAAEPADPLDSIEVLDEGADTSGKVFVEEHRRLEDEIRRNRRGQRKINHIEFQISRGEKLEDHAAELRRVDPSLGKTLGEANLKGAPVGVLSRPTDAATAGERTMQIRQYVLGAADEFLNRNRDRTFSIPRFAIERTKNAAGTVRTSSSSSPTTDLVENEATRVRLELFRSRKYKTRVHPGAQMLRP